MQTINRVRAGAPAPCAFVRSGCNWPEGGCAGNCSLHRVDSSQLVGAPFVNRFGAVEERDELPVQMHDDENGAMKMLAYAVALTLCALIAGAVIVGVMA